MRYLLVNLDDGETILTSSADEAFDVSFVENYVVIDTVEKVKIVDQRKVEIQVI